MGIDIENATRDELVAFYNETLAGEGEKISPASSKVAAQSAVKAALEAAFGAVAADAEVEKLHGTDDAPAADAPADDVPGDPPNPLGVPDDDPEAPAAAPADTQSDDDAEDESTSGPDPDAQDGDDYDDYEDTDDADEVSFDCDICGDNGLIPRCPYCGTERRS